MKYFKWTPELETNLCKLHTQGLTYAQIAEKLGCSIDSAKKIGSKYLKSGLLERRDMLGIERKGVFRSTYSEKELIGFIKEYKTKENAPHPVVYKVVKKFGSWGKGLEVANMPKNQGGFLDPSKSTILYLIKFAECYKIGITQQTLKQRFAGSPPFLVIDIYESELEEVLNLEREILNKVTKKIPRDPWFERNGKTECFISYDLISSINDLL